MKKAKYTLIDGRILEVEYDETNPCRICGLPVMEASMGGIDVCPWCDCGNYRDGEKWTLEEASNYNLVKKRAREKEEIKEELEFQKEMKDVKFCNECSHFSFEAIVAPYENILTEEYYWCDKTDKKFVFGIFKKLNKDEKVKIPKWCPKYKDKK
jgi:hypothetical protein